MNAIQQGRRVVSDQTLSIKLLSAIRQQLTTNNERLGTYYTNGATVSQGAPSVEEAVALRGANEALRKVLSDCGVEERPIMKDSDQ